VAFRIAAAQADLCTGTKPVKGLVEAAWRIDRLKFVLLDQAGKDISSLEFAVDGAVLLNFQNLNGLHPLVRRPDDDSRQPSMLPQNGIEIGQRPHANRAVVRRRDKQPAIGREGERAKTLRVSGKLAQPLPGLRMVDGQTRLSVIVAGDGQERYFYGLS